MLVRRKKGMKDKGREICRQSERERIKKKDYSRERARNIELGVKREKDKEKMRDRM